MQSDIEVKEELGPGLGCLGPGSAGAAPESPPPTTINSEMPLVAKIEQDPEDRDNECTICLEPLLDADLVGMIPSCCGHNKYYHDRCITQWSCNSNSCPTCRKRFHRVEIYRKDRPSILKQTLSVRDKLLSNDAINNIPSEYIIPAAAQPPVEEDVRSAGGVCSICSSSDYLSSLRNMLNCNFCGSCFHLDCIGITADTEMCSWCCPICDIDQELNIAYTGDRRAPRASRANETTARTGLPHRAPASRTTTPRVPTRTRVLRGTGSFMPGSSSASTRAVASTRPGLIIHNENNELDDSFLYDNDNDDLMFNTEMPYSRYNDFYPSPVINGGVLLRKEQRAQQNLSKEEMKSWEIFDVARTQKNNGPANEEIKAEESSTLNPSSAPQSNKRRRRKRFTPVNEVAVGSSNDMVKDNSSRINTLINQIKTSPITRGSATSSKKLLGPSGSGFHFPPPPTNQASTSGMWPAFDSPASISPSSNSPMDTTLNDSDTQYDSDSRIPKKSRPAELTLDQKIEIQKYIRNNLRVLYKPNHNDLVSNEVVISSEEAYIKINKTISRKIYGHILTEVENLQTADFSPIDEYFKDEDFSNLKELVDRYVREELKMLKNST